MLIIITSQSEKTPKRIAKVMFRRLWSMPNLIKGYTDLSVSRDDEDMFTVIACESKEKQVKDLVKQLETKLNFSAKWRKHLLRK